MTVGDLLQVLCILDPDTPVLLQQHDPPALLPVGAFVTRQKAGLAIIFDTQARIGAFLRAHNDPSEPA